MSGYKQPRLQPPATGATTPYEENYPPITVQPPPGYQPLPQQPLPTTTNITVSASPQVVLINGCPKCKTGTLEEKYTCCGICCAIIFFPVGLLCFFLMKQRRCTNCRASF